VRVALVIAIVAATRLVGSADALPNERKPITGFRVEGPTKLRTSTLAYLVHAREGDPVAQNDIPRLEKDLVSSELFEKVDVALEDDATGTGYIVVATLDDKMSWFAAPTLYFLGGNKAFGVGYVENNLGGQNEKVLMYGQIGNRDSLFYGAFLDPSIRGSPIFLRLDLYPFRRTLEEFVNPTDDPQSFVVARTSTTTYLGAGALVGWNLHWWLSSDLRLRAAKVTYSDAHAPDDSPLPLPEDDGYDTTLQWRVTLDHRYHNFGVTSGPFLQSFVETSIPGLDTYGYADLWLRGYYSWVFFTSHQLEVRSNFQLGYHLPFNEELVNGGVIDLRGYELEQFRGDLRATFRTEYSVPITKWRILAFRAIGFYDSAYMAWHFQRASRDYLPNQPEGTSWLRNDVGAGLRVYVKSVVLPLLGFDIAYGIEGHSPEIYFEVGLTDF
jgi:outer membrane protein insertion porin family